VQEARTLKLCRLVTADQGGRGGLFRFVLRSLDRDVGGPGLPRGIENVFNFNIGFQDLEKVKVSKKRKLETKFDESEQNFTEGKVLMQCVNVSFMIKNFEK